MAETLARSLIMHAAQDELDTARAAEKEAERAHKAAQERVLRAERALHKSKADRGDTAAEPSRPSPSASKTPAAESATKSASEPLEELPPLRLGASRREAGPRPSDFDWSTPPAAAPAAAAPAAAAPSPLRIRVVQGEADEPQGPSPFATRRATAGPLPRQEMEKPSPRELETREPLRIRRTPDAPFRTTGPRIALAAVLGVAALALVAAGLMLKPPATTPRHPLASPASSPTAPVRPAGPAVTRPTPSDQAITAAKALVGSWASQGLTCEEGENVRLSVRNGVLSYAAAGTSSQFTIEPSPEPNVVRARYGKDEYRFRVDHESLSMVGPNSAVTLTRCAG